MILASGDPSPAAAKRFATRVAVGLVAQLIETDDEEVRAWLLERAQIFVREIRKLHAGVQALAGPAAGEAVPVALPDGMPVDTGGKLGHQPAGLPAPTGPVAPGYPSGSRPPRPRIPTGSRGTSRRVARPLDAAIRLAREATVPRRARRRRKAIGQALVAIELASGVSIDALLDALSPRRRTA
jgi:hypothetical protein